METVYDQLVKLQRMTNAWEDWAEYRNELTSWIIHETEEASSVLIVGAGACNDFHLVSLGEHFSKIYLLDQSVSEMEQALTKQVKDEALMKKFQCIEGNITGLTRVNYRTFSTRLKSLVSLYGVQTDIRELSKIAISEMEQAYQNRKPDDYLFRPDSVDYCICCGVHSQLNSMFPWIWDAFCQALKKQDSSVFEKAREFNNQFIPKFHDLLFQAAKKGVLFAMEESRVGIPGGVEGAFQGIADLNNRLLSCVNDPNEPVFLTKNDIKIALRDQTKLLWPFNPREQILYSMQLCSFEREK